MKKIILLGLVSFLLAGLWLLPLSFAKPYAEKYVKGLHLKGVTGTVWRGGAQSLTIAGLDFDEVNWRVLPLKSLTSLSLKLSFDIDSRDFQATGFAGLTPSKKVIIDDMNFDLDAKYINTIQKYAKTSGDIIGNIKHGEFDETNLPIVNAVIDWKAAAVSSPIKLAQGDYQAIITPESDGIHINLASSDAPMELDGSIKLNKEWLYDVNVNVKSSDPSLAPMIGILGKKQPNGTTKLTRKGDLKPLIGKK